MNEHITAERLLELIGSGATPVILDVRSDREFAAGHVPGAAHLPFWQVSRRASTIPATKDQELIVYCGHGPRALIAGRALRKQGFTRVVYLKGHFSQWHREGHREERN